MALAALVAGAAVGVSGCHRKVERPDIVLVTIDTLRSDHCSSYGYPVATTPNLDALAARGVLFRRAYAESSTTAPSHAVLMTGRHFRSFGLTKNGGILPPDVVTLATALREGGYATAAFVSSFPVMTRFGFSQGFEVYDDNFVTDEASVDRRKPGETPHDRMGEATLAHLKGWIEKRHDDRPLFLWMHFVDPHAPYHAPEKFEATWPEGTAGATQRYDGEVHYADKQLGGVLDLFARYTPGRDDLIVVTSDHGEGLGDHGWMSHGINLHEEAVRVPLVASWAGHLPVGEISDDLVGLIDVAPGILDMVGVGRVGVGADAFAHGQNLFGAVDPARSMFLQRRDYRSSKEHGKKIGGEMTAVVQGTSKLILAPVEQSRELYDLAADPHEMKDLLDEVAPSGAVSSEREAKARKLERALGDWHKAFPAVKGNAAVDKETLKALRSLGYVD